jgi:Cu2+-exporting ATPase
VEHEHHDHSAHDKHEGHSPDMFKKKFWLSLALTVPTLLFSETVQGWFGFEWMFTGSEFIPAILGTIIFLYGGLVFLKGARAELRDRALGMMTLISLAITVAFGYSLAVTLGLDGMDFWWELATLVTIMLLGHWLEMASVMHAQNALQELAKLLPDEAELVMGNEIKTVPVAELKIGDRVLVRPGTNIPVDGVVMKGSSDVNESMITGESVPVNKSANSQVIGGTANGRGALTIKVTKLGGQTVLAGIMKLVADAQSSKSRTQLLADKAAFYLTWVAIAAAVLTFIIWTFFTNQPMGYVLERVVTVLVIACPHALGLAIPLVAAISTSLAAKNGYIVRRRIGLESARNISVVLFDKTGTLTTGNQEVIQVIGKKKEVIRLAASVEHESEHPIANAIVQYAHSHDIEHKSAKEFSALEGRGAVGKVDGKKTYVGGVSLLKELGVELPQEFKFDDTGKTAVYVVSNNKIVGAIAIGDAIRAESKEAVKQLHQAGKRVAILTGDSEGVAKWVADELNIAEYYAGVLPENKARVVRDLQSEGARVAFVGDGVNDAPALTSADIGIAIGAGTDVAIESADIVLAQSDPRAVAQIIGLSRAAYRKMLQNLSWAAGYNMLAIPLAAGVTSSLGFVLSPAFGAVLMSLSTIIVALNAQLLRRFRATNSAELVS